MTASVRFC